MRQGRRDKKLALLTALVVIASAAVAPAARAELTERGDLFVNFQGGIDPVALPRTHLAPISVHVAGTITTLSGENPPALREITIELNKGGKLDTRGLPICHYRELVAASPQRALEACGDAFVGEGVYHAQTAFPEQAAFPARGHILAFNSIFRGYRAILAHIFGDDPVPITRIIAFRVRSVGGTYGTEVTGALPDEVNHYGYVESISLRLHRRFVYRGQQHSYLSASCAAPLGFSRALFPFARTSMTFSDGRVLASTLTRSCTVSS
jgi:hypothetical protein